MPLKRYLEFVAISLIILLQLVLASQFTPTWDFPAHFFAGLHRLHEVNPPPGYVTTLYGIFTLTLPIHFARIFPQVWFPMSYLLYGVVMGCVGSIFFYLLLRREWGRKTALLSFVLLFLLPRYIGHLHTNIKDIVAASFFISAAYFLARFIDRYRMIDGVSSMLFVTFAVNTKLPAVYFLPMFGIWILFAELFCKRRSWKELKDLRKSGGLYINYAVLFAGYIILPTVFWSATWPEDIATFFANIKWHESLLTYFNSEYFSYAFERLLFQTPIPVLLAACFGVYVLGREAFQRKHVAFFFMLLFFYSFLKYPLLRIPIIDDVRYFIEIYYAVALLGIVGVMKVGNRVKGQGIRVLTLSGIFLFCLYQLFMFHPYEINYSNLLDTHPDGDFWAASYKEAASYVNGIAPKDAVIFAGMAPDLAQFYMRDDLKAGFNTKPPHESDIVMVLNRPSLYKVYKMDEFIKEKQPLKVITARNGLPLTAIYVVKSE